MTTTTTTTTLSDNMTDAGRTLTDDAVTPCCVLCGIRPEGFRSAAHQRDYRVGLNHVCDTCHEAQVLVDAARKLHEAAMLINIAHGCTVVLYGETRKHSGCTLAHTMMSAVLDKVHACYTDGGPITEDTVGDSGEFPDRAIPACQLTDAQLTDWMTADQAQQLHLLATDDDAPPIHATDRLVWWGLASVPAFEHHTWHTGQATDRGRQLAERLLPTLRNCADCRDVFFVDDLHRVEGSTDISDCRVCGHCFARGYVASGQPIDEDATVQLFHVSIPQDSWQVFTSHDDAVAFVQRYAPEVQVKVEHLRVGQPVEGGSIVALTDDAVTVRFFSVPDQVQDCIDEGCATETGDDVALTFTDFCLGVTR